MPRYLISFPSGAMDHVTDEEAPEVDRDAHACSRAAKDAGVFVDAGGLDITMEPFVVDLTGAVTPGPYPGTRSLGGFTILDLPSREAAIEWAGRIARACRCPQQVQEIAFDPLV